MVKNDFKNLRVVTGRVRFHYLNLFEPRKTFKGKTPKYGICIIVSKGEVETIDNINRAIETALQLGEEIWAEEVLNNLIIPFRDGDMEWTDRPGFEGCYFLKATSMYKPEVVDDCCRSIINPEEVYSGCYGRVAIRFFPYKRDGKLGVGCCLHNVQKLEEGERLAFRISALEDFGEVDRDISSNVH